jgi:hypothetical protein
LTTTTMDSASSFNPTSTTSNSSSSMTYSEKFAHADELEEKLMIKQALIAHFELCDAIEIAATLALNQFQETHSRSSIEEDPDLIEQESRLISAKIKASNDRFAAWRAAYPPTLEKVLWIVANHGYTREVAAIMNISKFTRNCKFLQPVMREERNGRGKTQLRYFCEMGLTKSVARMLSMRNIDVEAKGGGISRWTCLMAASYYGHVDICRLLIEKGANVKAIDDESQTALHWASWQGHVEVVRLLCDHGANIEACDGRNMRPLHLAAWNSHFSVVKEFIEVRKAEINPKKDNGWTPLKYAKQHRVTEIADYIVAHGGTE